VQLEVNGRPRWARGGEIGEACQPAATLFVGSEWQNADFMMVLDADDDHEEKVSYPTVMGCLH